jgi:hypothetical protein
MGGVVVMTIFFPFPFFAFAFLLYSPLPIAKNADQYLG